MTESQHTQLMTAIIAAGMLQALPALDIKQLIEAALIIVREIKVRP